MNAREAQSLLHRLAAFLERDDIATVTLSSQQDNGWVTMDVQRTDGTSASGSMESLGNMLGGTMNIMRTPR